MNPHDYIVSVNEKGEPYLEHALFGKGSQRQDHKYYTRVQDKGRWRYFYSPQEFRIWQTGGSKKKVTNTDKMRSAFKQLKETGQKVAEKAKDIAGVDERQRMRSAKEKLDSDSTNALNRFKRHTDYTKAKSDYDKTLLGRTERMKEELRKKAKKTANEVSDKVKEKVKEKVDDMKETYQHNKEQFEKAKEMERAEAERQAKLENRPKGHEKPESVRAAKEGAMKRRSMEKSTYGEYKDGDHDFDDDNYKEENRVGDTDFFVHKRKDGTNVILEEDMKWVLPKGVDAKSPAVQKAIKDFSDEVESARQLGKNYTGQQWRDAVTKAIDEAVRNTPVSGVTSVDRDSRRQETEARAQKAYETTINKPREKWTKAEQEYVDAYNKQEIVPKVNSSRASSIDPHLVSPEYVLTLGYNSGLNIKPLKAADKRHADAQSAYNRALSNPNTSSQEKDRLFRELTKAEQAYYDEANKIIDEYKNK